MNKFDAEEFLKIERDSGIIFFIWELLIFLVRFSMNYLNLLATFTIILKLILLMLIAIGCSKRMLYGPICGLLIGILMMSRLHFGDIITFTLGLMHFIGCIHLIKYIKNEKKQIIP